MSAIYRFYENSSSSRLHIPVKTLRALFPNEDIKYVYLQFAVADGKKGLFLSKSNGEKVRFRLRKGKNSSLITIPISIAKALGWQNRDQINLIFTTYNDKKGLFLHREQPIKE
ncbi:MAG: hypothetical protein P8Y97_21130 [Candidatus Lokiarchaeota archaeon]